jgi:hypothetical protein
LAIQQKESSYSCDETFDRFWLVNIKIRCLNIPLWKIINEQGMCRPKTLLEDTMWSPEFNNAAIVEYTAAIPEAKAKPAVALPFYILFHKLISVRVAVAAINISIFLFSK